MRAEVASKALVCPVCQAAAEAVRVPYINRDHAERSTAVDVFSGVENRFCSSCGFGWVNPPVATTDLDRFYKSEYWSAASHGSIKRPVLQDFAPLEARSVAQLTLVRMYAALEGAVLDIGPGPRGVTFRAVAQVAPQMRRFAIEPDPSSGDFLSRFLNVTVIRGAFPAAIDLATVGAPGGFEVLLMSHVLEHFNGDDVVPVLAAAGRLLSATGVLLCEVPHVDFRRHAAMRRNDCPHLSFFTLPGLLQAFEGAGLEVVFADTCGPQYDDWWRKNRPGFIADRTTPSSRVRHALKAAARRIPVRLPKPVWARLYSLLDPHATARMLQSDAFDYGGDRTWLRAVGTRR